MAIKTMSASAVVKAVAEKTGFTAKDISRILAAEAEVVNEGLLAGEAVVLLGGGAKALIQDKPARTVRNPQTGESMEKPASKAVKIKPMKPLKDLVA